MRKLILIITLLITSSLSAQTRPHWLQLKGSPVVDVRTFGAIPNDAIDDTVNIQAAVTAAGSSTPILITGGRYLINPIYQPLSRPDVPTALYGGIRLGTGQTLIFSGSGEFKNSRSDKVNMGSLINIPFAEDVTIIDPFLTGNYTAEDGNSPYSYTSGEQGMGIFINQSKRVRIFGGLIQDCGGDGITFSNLFSALSGSSLGGTQSLDCLVDGTVIRHCGRQGITVGGLKNGLLTHLNISDIWGTAPKSGVDFEPNVGTPGNENVTLSDSVITDADYGVLVYGNENNRISISGVTVSSTTYCVAVLGSDNISTENCVLSPLGTASTTLKIPQLSSAFVYGGSLSGQGNNYVTNNNKVILPSDGKKAAIITPTAVGTRTGSMSFTRNNIFIPGDLLHSLLPGIRSDVAHTGTFKGNIIHIASGAAPIGLAASFTSDAAAIPENVVLNLRDRWEFSDNTFINNCATALTPTQMFGTDAKLVGLPFNTYRALGGQWVNTGATAALQRTLNYKRMDYHVYTGAPGVASGASEDVVFNIFADFITPNTTAPGPFFTVDVCGSQDPAGESYEFTGGITSYDSVTGSVTVRIHRMSGVATQRALVTLSVSGYTLNSLYSDR
jgi:hypothetical protein